MNSLLRLGRRRQGLLAYSRAFATESGALTAPAPKLPADSPFQPSKDSPFLRFATPVPQPTNHQQIFSTIPPTQVTGRSRPVASSAAWMADHQMLLTATVFCNECRPQPCPVDCAWPLRPGLSQTLLLSESGLTLAADMRLKSTMGQLISLSTCLSRAPRFVHESAPFWAVQ